GHQEIVKILLEQRTVANGGIDKAFEVACIAGQLVVVKELLQAGGVDIAAVVTLFPGLWLTEKSFYQLHHLTGICIAKFMLGIEGVDATVDNNRCLRLAVGNGHADVVKVLSEVGGVDPADNDNAVLKWSIEMGRRDVVKVLLEVESVVAALDVNEALFLACQHGRLEVMKLLLEVEGVDIAASNNHAIAVAAENGHASVVGFLLTLKDVDPSARGKYAHKMAVKNGHAEVAKLLEAAGYKSDDQVPVTPFNTSIRGNEGGCLLS
ncbi:hypothetical protein HDU76_001266, partial [Blyttiomyces sp. JEL0837]